MDEGVLKLRFKLSHALDAAPEGENPQMNIPSRGWVGLQADEGQDFLAWLDQRDTLHRSISLPAMVLSGLLREEINSEESARQLWDGVPRALSHDQPETMDKDWGVVRAYAWLHFLERYARTRGALKHLVKESRLPMGRHSVRTLDAGAGLGPAALAVHDFYGAMVDFAEKMSRPSWYQPPEITCVENANGFTAMRNQIWEMCYAASGGEWPKDRSEWHMLTDFNEIRPVEERAEELERLRSAEDRYWDEARQEEASDRLYTDDEANRMSQSTHRYRLFVCSNLFTSKKAHDAMGGKLSELLNDANAGSVLLIMGAEGGEYQTIYAGLRQIAQDAGFQTRLPDATASSKGEGVDKIVSAEAYGIFEHARRFAAPEDPDINKLGQSFAEGRVFPANAIRAFRKH